MYDRCMTDVKTKKLKKGGRGVSSPVIPLFKLPLLQYFVNH